MNTVKMFWMMLVSLRNYPNVKGMEAEEAEEVKEAFWEWYWGQIPDERYSGENLWDVWDTFKSYLTGKYIIFNVRMWWESRFNHKNFGYSYTFNKNGYFINRNQWFTPCDKSFSYGCVDTMAERRNGNPLFHEN